MLEIAVLALTAVINLLLGLIVYLKNPNSATNRLFFLLASVFVGWSIVNYLSEHPVWFGQIIWIRLVLCFGALLNLSVLLTFLAFPLLSLPLKYSRKVRLATISTVFVMLLTLTPYVFKGLTITNGKTNPIPAPGIALFLAQTIILIGASLFTLIVKFKTSSGKARDQLRLILFAVAGTFSCILITNFLLVIFFNITLFVAFGPAFTLIFSLAFTYAIVKHRLFDIRQAAARGLGYVFTIIFMAIVYSFVVFGISSLIFDLDQPTMTVRVVYGIIAILLALSFQPIKRFFDRITNRFFFKDAYDPQQFLDQLNKVLVERVNLKELLNEIGIIMNFQLKSNGSAFIIYKTAYAPERIIGAVSKFNNADIVMIKPKIKQSYKKVIVADYLEGVDQRLGDELKEKNIAVVIRLIPNFKQKTESIGELILGPKKSGDPYTNSDIQLLEIIANELVVAIENALRFEEIQHFNLTLQARVNNATHQLQRANERLRELDETKDDFISMASHQLRTPLTSVKGYISMVLEGDAGRITKMEREMLGQAFMSSQRMVYLIADLLNVSRLKTGKFIIDSHEVNLALLVQEELGQLKETAAARKLNLCYDMPKDFPNVMLDETKTRQVIMNFVDNAIYYTPAGGKIDVVLNNNANNIELKVIDNGIGVSRSEQPHLFTKFYRAGNARKARPDGTGLGLFMAKKVILAEGGSLIFESQEGKGSTFGFMFSKAKIAVNTPLPSS